MMNQWYRIWWWVTCHLGRHQKYSVVTSQANHTPLYDWCIKCDRKWRP